MWKNIAAGRARDDKFGACAFHAGYLRLQTHTVGKASTYCFSIATWFARTRLIVALHVCCLSCFNLIHVLDFLFYFWKSHCTNSLPHSMANLGWRQYFWYHRVYKIFFFNFRLGGGGWYCPVPPMSFGCTSVITSVQSCYRFTYTRLIPVILLFLKLVTKKTDVTNKRQYFRYHLC